MNRLGHNGTYDTMGTTSVWNHNGEIYIEWVIPKFLSLPANYEFKSDFIKCDDWRWFFSIYIYDSSNDSRGEWVDLLLMEEDIGPPQLLKMTLGIKDGVGKLKYKSERLQEFSSNTPTCSWSRLIQRKMLIDTHSGLMPEGNLIIVCIIKNIEPNNALVQRAKIKIKTEEMQCSEKEALKELQSSLQNLLKSEEDCDIVLNVQGKEFRAHRLILQARSPVFRAMFVHDMLEKQKGVVTIEDCDSDSFPDFLEHIYTGAIEMISTKNVFSLYTASDKYGIKSLQKECKQFIKENMTVSSFCDTIMLALKYNEEELKDSTTEFFCRNSIKIIKTVQWEIFLKENTTVGNELLIKLLSKHEKILLCH